jgi:NADH-quinone oxidoreductase subunit J
MNGAAFIVISILTLAGALAAATLPNLMHAAFCFVVALLGLASFFFLLGAEFVGLALVFIYIGAVAVLIVFTILLTRRDSKEHHGINPPTPNARAARAWSGILIALAVFAGLMTGYVWPLQCVGLLLTAALIGALVLVMEEKR